MIHPHTELRIVNEEVGYGVFATQRIPRGTITYVKDSLEVEISPTDFLNQSEGLQALIERYSYIDERGVRIVSWDFAKYVNHCCCHNTISTGYGFELAIRDIEAGEEITDEYGVFNLQSELTVSCGEEMCRRIVRPSDFDEYYPQWDESIRGAMTELFKVPQPLMWLVDPRTRADLEELQVRPESYRSVYTLRYRG